MKINISAVAVFSVALATFSSVVNATNGMFLIGNGAKSRAMGGVGIGYTQDTIGGHQNPAGITNIGVKAMRVDADAMLFRPIRRAGVPDPRTSPPNGGNLVRYQSGSNLFAIPSLAMTYKFNRKMYIGMSFVGAGGGNTRYVDRSPIGFNFLNPAGRTDVSNTLGVSLIQAQMSMTLAYKANKRHSIAASPVVAIQQFRAYGLGVFKTRSADPDNLTDRGNDYSVGLGARLGWQGKMTDWLSLGAVYQSRIFNSKFEKYSGLFGAKGSLDVPEQYGVGLALKPVKKLTIAFDWQRVLYSKVNAIGTEIEVLSDPNRFLGSNGGAGFGWNDQDVYKLGLKYQISPKWDVMLGYNYGEAPMPKDQLLFSTLAPAVTEKHLTLGAAYRPSKSMEWTFAYVHAFRNTEKGLANSGGQFDVFFPNATNDGPGPAELEMYQDSLELTFAFKL
ncbi:MAG: outer membrane protein transport protein [Gammaproteobacteria bacterium]